MPRKAIWNNPDGLAVGFGKHTEDNMLAAQPSLGGRRQQIVMKIVGTELNDTDVTNQLIQAVTIPADSLLESAKLFVTTAFAGATATLDGGTYDSAGAAVDADGLFAAVAVASLGDNVVVTGGGAQIGTVLQSNQRIAFSYNTAAFTAGEATLVVEYIPKF